VNSQSEEDMDMAAKFKKGDRITYRGIEGVITGNAPFVQEIKNLAELKIVSRKPMQLVKLVTKVGEDFALEEDLKLIEEFEEGLPLV
jgi:hypothetical protein